jgi:hypothetical protein
MLAKANSPFAVVTVLIAETINSNPAIPRQILDPARPCCGLKEYNHACHASPHWHSFWIL